MWKISLEILHFPGLLAPHCQKLPTFSLLPIYSFMSLN
jgi:hypothetical protein